MLQRKTLAGVVALFGGLAIAIVLAVHRPSPPPPSLLPSHPIGQPEGQSPAGVERPSRTPGEERTRKEVPVAPDTPQPSTGGARKRSDWTASIYGRLRMRDGSDVPAGTFVGVLTGVAEIDFAPPRAGEPRSFVPLHRESAQADGSFSIPVPPTFPRFRFAVESAFAVLRAADEFVLESSRVREGVVLELEPAGSVEGTILGPAGQSPKHGRALLYVAQPWSSPEPWMKGGVADSAGRFSVSGVPPGRVKVSALADRCAPAPVAEVDVRARGTARVELSPPPESFVTGRVLDVSGAGASCASGRVEPMDPNLEFVFRGFALDVFQTDPRGTFRVENLPAESVRISVFSSTFPRTEVASHTIALAPGKGVEGLEIRVLSGRFLSGRVVDEFGRPVAKAKVAVTTEVRAEESGAKFDSQRVLSGPDGAFLVAGLGDGPFQLEASGVGRGAAEVRHAAPDTQGIELRLPGPTGFAGVVLDEETAKPVPRFRVYAFPTDPETKIQKGGGEESFESAEGRFELADLGAGVHGAHLRSEGYVLARVEGIDVRIGEIAPGIEVRMRRTATIRGKVVDAISGEPVGGALVNPRGSGQIPRGGGPFDMEKNRSRPDGAFEVSGVVPGRLRLEAAHPAYPPVRTDEIEVRSGEVLEGVVVHLSRGGALEGIVPGESGLPWVGADVFVFPEPGRAHEFRNAIRTDSKGYFSVGSLDAGRYRVKALPPRNPGDTGESREALAQVAFATVEAGRTTRVEFPGLTRGCTVVGRVLRGTEGVPGVRVVLRPARSRLRPDEFPWDEETGDGGAFVFRHVPPGEATVSVWGDGDDPINAAFPIEVPDAPRSEVSCRLPGGEIVGRVVRADDGSPIEKVDINVRASNPLLDGTDVRRPGHARTDSEGRYRVVGLAPGMYQVGAFDRTRQADAHAAASRDRVEVAEGSPAGVDFSLSPGARARVAVVDSLGRSVEGASVALRLSSGMEDMREWRWTARTGPDGAALVVGLVPGRFYVAVRTPDDRVAFSEDREVNREAEGEFRVEVGEGTLVRVRMADEEGERVDGGCTFTDARGRRAMGRFIAQGPPDVAGALVASLPPGEWTVRAMANGYGVHTLPLRVEAGGPVDLPVVMRRAGRQR